MMRRRKTFCNAAPTLHHFCPRSSTGRKRTASTLQKPKRAAHEHEVATRYAGELIQHDASYHLWAPLAKEKWYLITSLDDYSRFMLYAALLKEQTAWTHIAALESVFLGWGFPYTYYVDSHSIFRFVQGRDSFWRKHERFTDEADPQWKQVLKDCNVKVDLCALAPGKRQDRTSLRMVAGSIDTDLCTDCQLPGLVHYFVD